MNFDVIIHYSLFIIHFYLIIFLYLIDDVTQKNYVLY
jgi:hypothetical protein